MRMTVFCELRIQVIWKVNAHADTSNAHGKVADRTGVVPRR